MHVNFLKRQANTEERTCNPPAAHDHILAVGMDGEDDGTLTGLAINLFDISDFSNPQLKFQHTLDQEGWSWSESLWNHHAFTFHRGVLTIPAYSWNYDEQEGYELFSLTNFESSWALQGLRFYQVI